MPRKLLLAVLIGVSLVAVAGWLMLQSRMTATPDQLFKKADVLKVPHFTEAMDFTLLDVNAREVRLADLRGKTVLLNFWTTWCPPCRSEMPDMEKLYQKFKNRNFAMVAVSMRETAEVVKQFTESHRLNFTVVLDQNGEVSRRFRIRSIPTSYILNTRGQIVGAVPGPRKWSSGDMIALFKSLTAEPMIVRSKEATNR
jgi:peroxiredoxin